MPSSALKKCSTWFQSSSSRIGRCALKIRSVLFVLLPTRATAWRITSTSLRPFFNDTATTEIYTLSLHDALPILKHGGGCWPAQRRCHPECWRSAKDRKSTRLNSSHLGISYAVFCLKKKKNA